MIIYYPTYYLVPVAPVMFSNENGYNTRCNTFYNDEYNGIYSDDYPLSQNNEYNDNHDSRYTITSSEIYNPYRTINEDIFYDVDEEYVNDSIK
ncbi:hypothetical protein [Clostridium sp.]|uniref:hypothetical protein n=1 Tax=Clostridium sp. TaxID=1506 RepID=UPI002616ABF3|nr:hypothetical protein [uncultured Clostridium sp.]